MSEDITRGSHRRAARCTYCNQIVQGKIDRLAKHMELQCKEITAEARAEYSQLVINSGKGSKLSMGSPSSSKSAGSQRSLKRARHSFTKLEPFAKRDVRQATKEKAALLHIMLLKAFITGHIPFEFLQDRRFQEYQRQLSRSEYKPPTPTSFEDTTLPLLHAENQTRISRVLTNQTSLTLSLSGWTDASKNITFSLFALRGSTIKEFLAFIDLYRSQTNPNDLYTEVTKALEQKSVAWESVTAVVSNSSRVSPAFRVFEACSHVILIHPVSHFLKLIAKDIMKHPLIEAVLQTNKSLSQFFTVSPYWAEELSSWRQKEGLKRGLQTANETRWYPIAKGCISVSEHEPGLRTCLSTCLDPKLDTPAIDLSTRLAIDDQEHFTANSVLASLLRPLLDALANLQHAHATVSSIWQELLSVYTQFQRVAELCPHYKPFKDHALQMIDSRSRVYDQDIYIIGLFLHPQYRRTATSRKYSLDHLNWKIINLAQRWGFTLPDAKSLRVEVLQYHNGDSIYKLNLPGSLPIHYWRSLPVTTEASPLKRLAVKVLEIVPNVAGIQSLSCLARNSKTTPQNRMNPNTLKMISEIQMHLRSEAKGVTHSQGQSGTIGSVIASDVDKNWEGEGFDLSDEDEVFESIGLADDSDEDQCLLAQNSGCIESLFDLNVFHQDNMFSETNQSGFMPDNDIKDWNIKDVFL